MRVSTFSPLFIGSRNVTTSRLNGDSEHGSRSFSPLFIGSRNVTQVGNGSVCALQLSVPFSSGQGMLHNVIRADIQAFIFQSPFHRVKECYTIYGQQYDMSSDFFQSPFHRVKECYQTKSTGITSSIKLSVPFSSGQGMLRITALP